jgi:hypothetical protein
MAEVPTVGIQVFTEWLWLVAVQEEQTQLTVALPLEQLRYLILPHQVLLIQEHLLQQLSLLDMQVAAAQQTPMCQEFQLVVGKDKQE